MTKFITDDFMLQSDFARELYHESAKGMPIIDYHCHLDPRMIAQNYKFDNLTEAWLGGDHYKWRAMRGNGVSEDYITGSKSDYEKFEKWAEAVPYTMRNPLYHWTHLELVRVFGVDKILNPSTAREIYDECQLKLQSDELRAQSILQRFGVETLCTTDDPIDSLEFHKAMTESPFETKILPTWRPDKAMAIDSGADYCNYLDVLGGVVGFRIDSYEDLLSALQSRHDYFAEVGCRLSDHGLSTFYAEDYSDLEVSNLFKRVRRGDYSPTLEEKLKFQSALLVELAKMNSRKGWIQQFHIGAIRNNNSRMWRNLGADCGCDAIGDLDCAASGHRFLDRLEVDGELAKTILYNLNPKDSSVLATMAYTFNDGSCAGKMQYGAAWWFLDQEQGIVDQLNTLSVLGLLGRFVGMLTDSRSLLSYPRHEYFRRILCNMLGDDIEKGKLPRSEMAFIHQMVKDISYHNARRYFEF